mgnify:CR=1 FL=1
MQQELRIWSPVVVASWPGIRLFRMQACYPLNGEFEAIEYMRLKTGNTQVICHGKTVEVAIEVEILSLMKEAGGNSRLLNRKDTLRDRLPLQEFRPLVQSEQDVDFIIDIKKIDWDGNIREQEILVTYYIDYCIFGVKEQVVSLLIREDYGFGGGQGSGAGGGIVGLPKIGARREGYAAQGRHGGVKLFIGIFKIAHGQQGGAC